MTRVVLLKEHITTIEKSMNQINELSADPGANINQLVRWVNNKDTHADEFNNIVTYYFLTQRIKIKESGDGSEFELYQDQTTTLHQMMVFAMKCKQTTDLKNVEKLRTLLDQFVQLYFSEEDQQHLKDHHN
jgi:nickel superoxide dismutase